MKNLKHIVSVLTVLVTITVSKAQDFHLSQFDVATMYLNPALTGMYGTDKGDYRVYFDQRSQWKALGVKPYLTTFVGYDMPFFFQNKKYGSNGGKTIGAGLYILHNRAGLGNYNTTNFILSGSYDILDLKAQGKHYLTTGLQMGVFYRHFDENSLTYDTQYSLSADGFDQSISSGESYAKYNITRFDANFGVFYKYLEKGKKAHPFAGFSISHLTKPNESYLGNKSKMPMKFVFNGGCDIQIDEKFDISPRLLYMNQAKAYEFDLGVLAYYKVSDNDTRVMAGLDWRYKDAVVIHVGLKQESYQFRLSYDINTSYLKTYSRGRGAFEISLIYTGEKGKSFIKSVSKY
jgi:type IX secretion system PorP/SprF family membrane protein